MNIFENFGLSHQLTKAIERLDINKPTQIQEESIPHIIKGKDIVGESATGSGKTLAFGCGIIDKVNPNEGLQALIITPTRELAEQVKESIKQLSHDKPLKIMATYGGVSIGPQIDKLTKANVVVATPGRLLDHIQRKTINISKVKILVLDEADRMLDMGFIDDVEKIIKECPKERQTLFFSATISPDIKRLANKYMMQPLNVSAKKYVDSKKLKQIYYDISKNMKFSLLVHLYQQEKAGLVMVFCNTRRTVDFVAKNLRANKIKANAIHGGLSQNKRTNTINSFNNNKIGILVCTDVAARGLHINNVSHIYNYEIPKNPIDYVHRIGRTARAGEEGKVINLLCDYGHDNFNRVLRDYNSFSIERAEKTYIKKIPFVKDRNFSRNKRPLRRRPSFRNNYHNKNR